MLNNMRHGFSLALSASIILTLVGCSSPRIDNTAGWPTFQSDDFGFNVLMPGTPQKISREVPSATPGVTIPIFVFTTTESGGPNYDVTVTVLPRAFNTVDAQSVLANALDGLKQAYSGSTITQKIFSAHEKKPSLDFVLSLPASRSVRGMMISVDHQIYQVTITGDVANNNHDALFLQSFHLL